MHCHKSFPEGKEAWLSLNNFYSVWGYFDNFLKSNVPVFLTFPSWHSFAKISFLRTNPTPIQMKYSTLLHFNFLSL